MRVRGLWWLGLFSAVCNLFAEPYTLGHGVQINDTVNVGGYFSSEFESNSNADSFTLDDVAVMAYGDVNPMFSYLAELEAVGFYHKNLTDGTESGKQKFHAERFYGDLWLCDAYNLRFGKQLTPIGYWNLEPINVLRDTTSNPLYSTLLFPRFLTGIDINGDIPESEGVKYHLFGQATRDVDEEYINIPNSHFYGLSVNKDLSMESNIGGSIGEYIALRTHERTRFIQANAKYDNDEWSLTVEAIAAQTEYMDNRTDRTISGYAQGMYRFDAQNAIVGRYEYYDRRHDDYTDHVGIIGYSYRPLYPISLKGEYQWHSQSGEDRFLASFSVLF